MSLVIINLFGCLQFNESVFKKLDLIIGECNIHVFPDGESLARFNTDMVDKEVLVIADLSFPNTKFLSLIYAAQTARELGARKIHLFVPYLPYMRQDKQFHPGEGITSRYFAKLLSTYFDSLVTVEPHLHRWHALTDIYTISTTVLDSHDSIARWLQYEQNQSVLIGPDRESEQWVSAIAKQAGLPFVIFDKVRHDDKVLAINSPSLAPYQAYTAVIIDDVISTGRTMMKVIEYLQANKISAINCVGVHALFVDDAYEQLINSGADRVVTCNTITHPSNQIDISETLLSHFSKIIKAI